MGSGSKSKEVVAAGYGAAAKGLAIMNFAVFADDHSLFR